MNVYETICDIIKENLYLEDDFEFSEELTFNELSVDSLDKVEIVMAIEEEFDIEIADEEFESIRSLGEFTELVKSHIK